MRARDKHSFAYQNAQDHLRRVTWELADLLAEGLKQNNATNCGNKLWTYDVIRKTGFRDALKAVLWTDDWPK